jgi:hypothetical protein
VTGAQSKLMHSLSSRKTRLLHKIDHKLYLMSAKIQREPMLYRAEAQFFAWLCGQPWAQRRYWPAKVAVVERFLQQTNLLMANSQLTPTQVIQQALFCDNFIRHWRWRLNTWQPQQLAQIVTVRGWDAWRTAYEQRKGIILLSYHTLAARLILPWLAHAAVAPSLVLGSRYQVDNTGDLPNSPFLYARQLHAARSCLAVGGVVQILPDGFQGSGGISLPLYQRTRLFRTAFAELALSTGAIVTPASAILNLAGKIEITFHPPLCVGEKSQPRSEQMEALVKQYVAFLHTEWCAAPGNISIGHMEQFLKNSNPIVQEGSSPHVD